MIARAFFILFITAASLAAQNAPNWDRWQFLIGDWIGEGTGDRGQGSGGFSFRPELQNRVLVRRNRADYPATKDRPAFSHEDLMVVYPEGTGFRATYYDSEGACHPLRYRTLRRHDQLRQRHPAGRSALSSHIH